MSALSTPYTKGRLFDELMKHDSFHLKNMETDLALPYPKKELSKKYFNFKGAESSNSLYGAKRTASVGS